MSEETNGTKEERVEPEGTGGAAEAAEPQEREGEEEHVALTAEEEARLPAWRRALDWSLAAKGWAAVLSIVGATILSFYAAALKTDSTAVEAKDEVEEAWKVAQAQLNTLTTRVNKLSEVNDTLQGVVRKLSMRMVFLQAHEAGFRHGETHEKMLQLQRENEALRKGKGLPPREETLAGALEPGIDCRPGFVEVGGKCRRVGKDVAKELMEARAAEMAAKMKAAVEERRRKEAEAAKLAQQTEQKPAPKIRLLPKRLGDAARQLEKKEKEKGK